MEVNNFLSLMGRNIPKQAFLNSSAEYYMQKAPKVTL